MDKQKYIEQANRLSGFNIHNGIEVVDFDDEHCIVIGKLSDKTCLLYTSDAADD